MTAKKFNLKDFLINNGIIVVLVLLAIYTGIMQPTFVSGSNLKNIALNVAPRFIIACGVSGCLITKGTDLSAGRMVGLSACLAGTLLQKADYSGKFFPNMPFYGVWWVAAVLLICVAVCAIFGAINGIVVSYLQVPAFIGTLGMQLIVYGVCLVYTNATPIGGYRAAYTEVAKGQLFGFIPYLFLIALAVGIVMWFVYNKMPHGKYMYAIGGNEQAAEVSGVNTKKTKIIIYITAAACYALGETQTGVEAHVTVKPSYGLSDEEIMRMLKDGTGNAEEDMHERALREEEVESRRLIESTVGALASDADLLTKEEENHIRDLITRLLKAVEAHELETIKTLEKELTQATESFAERRMDRAIAQALSGKSVEDIEGK